MGSFRGEVNASPVSGLAFGYYKEDIPQLYTDPTSLITPGIDFFTPPPEVYLPDDPIYENPWRR